MILRSHITTLSTFVPEFIICSIWRSVVSSSKVLEHVGCMLHAYPALALLDICGSWEVSFVPLLFEPIANEKVDVSVFVNYVFSELVDAQVQAHLHDGTLCDELQGRRLLRAMQGASRGQELYVSCWSQMLVSQMHHQEIAHEF